MRTIHRVCFDFSTAEGALTFWEVLEDNGFEDCQLVHKDGLHDSGKHVKTYLVRGRDSGNGRPLKISTVPAVEETLTIES